MTFEEIIAKVRDKAATADTSSVNGTLAIQINLVGKNIDSVFYIEVKEGNVNVEPYDYHDRAAMVTVAPTNFVKLIDGKLNPVIAYTTGKVKVEGDPGAVLQILGLVK